MATKGYASLWKVLYLSLSVKSILALWCPLSLPHPSTPYYTAPPKIEIMLWHCFYVKRHTYCTCNKGWCVMDAHRPWEWYAISIIITMCVVSVMYSWSKSLCLCLIVVVPPTLSLTYKIVCHFNISLSYHYLQKNVRTWGGSSITLSVCSHIYN